MATIIDPPAAEHRDTGAGEQQRQQRKKPRLAIWFVALGSLVPIAFVISVVGLAMTSTGSTLPGPVPTEFMVAGMLTGLGSLAWILALNALRS